MPTASVLPAAVMVATDRAAEDKVRLLRRGVYLYLLLWVFEGALRKWIVPGLANPLLVVRDPVLIGLYGLAYVKGVFPRSAFIPWIAGLGVLATFVSLAATDAPLVVTAYGLRCDYLHLPLIFLLPVVLRREDLRLVGKYWLVVAAGMGALVLLQFRSGAGAFVNRGAGEGTQMLESAYGHIRPSGTFSYTNGLAGFTAIAAAFFLQHLLEKRVYPRLVWLAAVPALLIMVVLSGSRSAAGIVALILAGVFFVCVVQGRYRAASLKLVALLGVMAMLAGSFAVARQGLDVFSSRFSANKVEEHGFTGRYLQTWMLPFVVMDRADAGGAGLGMGTNVAAGLATGQRKFMFSEGEGGRIILESGPAVGMAYILLRLAITVYLGFMAWRALREHAATLPLLLFSGCFNDVLLGQFSQPTELGFATIAGGLCLTASLRAGEPSPEESEAAEAAARTEVEEAAPGLRRGRTAWAVATAAAGPREAGQPTQVAPAAKVTPRAPAGRAVPVGRGRAAYAARLHANDAEGGGGPSAE